MGLSVSKLTSPGVERCPFPGRCVDQEFDKRPALFGHFFKFIMKVIKMERVQYLSKNVVLLGMAGVVANPDRTRIFISLKVAQQFFFQIGSASDSVENLHPGLFAFEKLQEK